MGLGPIAEVHSAVPSSYKFGRAPRNARSRNSLRNNASSPFKKDLPQSAREKWLEQDQIRIGELSLANANL
jgi:hypothetical protein